MIHGGGDLWGFMSYACSMRRLTALPALQVMLCENNFGACSGFLYDNKMSEIYFPSISLWVVLSRECYYAKQNSLFGENALERQYDKGHVDL